MLYIGAGDCILPVKVILCVWLDFVRTTSWCHQPQDGCCSDVNIIPTRLGVWGFVDRRSMQSEMQMSPEQYVYYWFGVHENVTLIVRMKYKPSQQLCYQIDKQMFAWHLVVLWSEQNYYYIDHLSDSNPPNSENVHVRYKNEFPMEGNMYHIHCGLRWTRFLVQNNNIAVL